MKAESESRQVQEQLVKSREGLNDLLVIVKDIQSRANLGCESQQSTLLDSSDQQPSRTEMDEDSDASGSSENTEMHHDLVPGIMSRIFDI